MKLLPDRSDVDSDWIDAAVLDRVTALARGLEPADATVGLVVVGEREIRELNARWRGRDAETDVVTFSYLEDPDAPDDGFAGEIYVCAPVIERDARRLGVAPRDLFVRIAVHGLLHVLGMDHERDDDAERMERRERELLEGVLAPDALERLVG